MSQVGQILLAGESTVTAVDFSSITDALTSQINVGTIGAVVGIVLASGVGLVVFWWGGRKIINGVMNAFKSGKLKV